MQLPVPKFYLAVFFICVLLVGLRSLNFKEQFRFIPDNGLEYAVMRQISLDRCSPLVGPMLSISDVYIPPTYFYYLYAIGGQIFSPFFTGYLSNLLKILTIVFLASTVWLMTNRRFFLICLGALMTSWLLFDTSRFMWHPNPVNLFLSISIFLLTYAKLRHRWQALFGSFIFYWLAASIYPSPLILLPWYLFEVIRWSKASRQYRWIYSGLGVGLLIATAVPFYLPQFIYEALNQWPTIRTIQQISIQQISTQHVSENTSLIQHSLLDLHQFLMTHILHIRYEWPGFTATSWFVTGSILILGIASIRNHSHRWQFYFPYLPMFVLIAQFAVIDHLFPGNLNQHWLSLFFIILVPSAFEAAHKLWASLPLRILSILLCTVLCIHNAGYYWESLTTAAPITDQLQTKIQRMQRLEAFWLNRDIRPKSILVLDNDNSDVEYTNTFNLQYSAMENWTLLHYQTLLPPMSAACNEYTFFEKPEIQQLAKNIFLLEPRESTPSPEVLFDVFTKKFSFDLDETKRASWYINTAATN